MWACGVGGWRHARPTSADLADASGGLLVGFCFDDGRWGQLSRVKGVAPCLGEARAARLSRWWSARVAKVVSTRQDARRVQGCVSAKGSGRGAMAGPLGVAQE